MRARTPRVLFRLLSLAERAAAFAQGKGYGTATLQKEIEILRRFGPAEPNLAIDIGGNVGDYTAELRRQNPALEIHTFEPSKVNVEKLTSRFGSDSRVTIVPLAVSDRSGMASLYSDHGGSGLGSLKKRRLEHFDIAFDVEEDVKTIRFEDYWTATLQRRQLDLVKLDIEGHELAALEGFGSALKATRALQFEFGGCNIDTRTYFQDFWYFFESNNFAIYRITPLGAQMIERYKECEEFFATTNFVAVNSG